MASRPKVLRLVRLTVTEEGIKDSVDDMMVLVVFDQKLLGAEFGEMEFVGTVWCLCRSCFSS